VLKDIDSIFLQWKELESGKQKNHTGRSEVRHALGWGGPAREVLRAQDQRRNGTCPGGAHNSGEGRGKVLGERREGSDSTDKGQ
jgi:hypothetical protein